MARAAREPSGPAPSTSRPGALELVRARVRGAATSTAKIPSALGHFGLASPASLSKGGGGHLRGALPSRPPGRSPRVRVRPSAGRVSARAARAARVGEPRDEVCSAGARA